MKILALEREMPNKGYEDFHPHLKKEAYHAWHLYQKGIIREIYFRDDKSLSVLVLECSGIDAAEEIIGSLPLVKEGLIEFDIIPLRPYPGFERLFSSEKL